MAHKCNMRQLFAIPASYENNITLAKPEGHYGHARIDPHFFGSRFLPWPCTFVQLSFSLFLIFDRVLLYDTEQRRPFIWPIRGHFLLCCSSFDSKLAAKKAVFGLFFKATKCVVCQTIRVLPNVSFWSKCFGLLWQTVKKMMDSTQLIVMEGGGGGERGVGGGGGEVQCFC